MKKFFQDKSNNTYTQKIFSALSFLGVWVFCLIVVVQSWFVQRHEIISLSKKIIFIMAIFIDLILMLISLLFFRNVILYKNEKDSIEKHRILRIIGFIFMLGSLWFLQYNSNNLELLILIFLIGIFFSLYSFYISYKR